MNELERRALARLARSDSVDELRQVMRNARGGSEAVHRAALLRLVQVSAGDRDGLVAHACWSMVFLVEEIRRETGRTVWRMNRMRRKIGRDGEQAALDYCARNRTEGFSEVLGYGLPHLTAEAIALRHPLAFAADTLERARARLADAGIDVDALLAERSRHDVEAGSINPASSK